MNIIFYPGYTSMSYFNSESHYFLNSISSQNKRIVKEQEKKILY